MTRDIQSAMAEYLEVADSLERWDCDPEQLQPVRRALAAARGHLLDLMTAFEQSLAQGPRPGLRSALPAASIPQTSGA